MVTSNDETKHRSRRNRENRQISADETSQEDEMENEIKRGDQKYLKRRKSAIISDK